jgi:ABC-type phosphate transport system substrate-binding protein
MSLRRHGQWLILCLALAFSLAACEIPWSLRRPTPPSPQSELALDNPALLRVATSWAGLPLMESLSEAYMYEVPATVLDVLAMDSRPAEALLREGKVDLALVIRPYDAEARRALLAEEDHALQPVVLALDALGVVVQQDHPLDGISTADMARLFAGYHPDWSALGGPSGQPDLVIPLEGTIPRALFADAVMGELTFSSSVRLAAHDREVLGHVREQELAVGLASRAWALGENGHGTKMLAIEGVAPEPPGILSGAYPLAYALVLLRAPDAPQAAVPFTAWCTDPRVRRSHQGQYLSPP